MGEAKQQSMRQRRDGHVDLQAMASMLEGVQVVFDKEPALHAQRLLNALGVIWSVRDLTSSD